MYKFRSNDWKENLLPQIWNSDTYGTFKKTILKFIRPSPKSLFECHNPRGIKFLTNFRLGLSHLCEHRFKHSFKDSLNPLCNKRGAEAESASDFLLHCPIYNNDRSSLLSTIRNTDSKLLEITDSSLTQALRYGNQSFDIITDSLILNATNDFILYTKRFEDDIFKRNNAFSYLFLNNQSINPLFR